LPHILSKDAVSSARINNVRLHYYYVRLRWKWTRHISNYYTEIRMETIKRQNMKEEK